MRTGNANEIMLAAMAARGGLYISDTSAHAGNFTGGFFALTDCVINTYTLPDFANSGATITSLTVPAFTWLPGRISTITLTSGTGLAIA